MPLQIHPIPTNPKVLGAYWTLNLNTLIPLFVLLFSLIFKASVRRMSHVRIVLGRPKIRLADEITSKNLAY
jgi:hypothetical protein